jgi:integrase
MNEDHDHIDSDAAASSSPTVIDAFLNAKQKGNDTGNYRLQAEHVLSSWNEWLRGRDVTDLSSIDTQTMRRYAQYLRQRTRAKNLDETSGGIAASTAQTYYAIVSGFLTWCVEDERISTNPARANRAQSELPEDIGESEQQQFWSSDDRVRLLHFVDRHASDAIDEHGFDATTEVRDRAIVYLLAYSGCRIGEIVHDPNDDRRRGLYWQDVDFEASTLRVLGKTQEWQNAAFPEQAHSALGRHQRLQSPPQERWPVFPTQHMPTYYGLAREQLPGKGYSDDEIETVLDSGEVKARLREEGIVPPNLTTRSARRILREMCEDAEIQPPEGQADYFQPHGGRRGAGDTLYREQGVSASQDLLRHQDPRTTSEAYRHIDATETANDASSVFEETDE